jgi:hypothetical protein
VAIWLPWNREFEGSLGDYIFNRKLRESERVELIEP